MPYLHPDPSLEAAPRYVDRWPLIFVVNRANSMSAGRRVRRQNVTLSHLLRGVCMSNPSAAHVDLQAMAKQIMLEHGFEPDFPDAVDKQMASIQSRPAVATTG